MKKIANKEGECKKIQNIYWRFSNKYYKDDLTK